MLTTAEKAFRVGFNVVRVNYRNCGSTEHLTPTLYHGGMSGDVLAVIEELIDRDRLSRREEGLASALVSTEAAPA